MLSLLRSLQAWMMLGLLTVSGMAHADFRDPSSQPFVVWPNIPVIRAADLGEYALDRQVFTDLHTGTADAGQMTEALQAVDALQAHHERQATQDLGRSLNAQLIAEIDQLGRRNNLSSARLRFEFSGIRPDQLQRGAAQDEQPLKALEAKADRLLVAYVTYTRMEGVLVQATATFVKLRSGESQSFTATAPLPLLASALAREVFDYFYGARFTPHRRLAAQWLLPAPGHADQLVSRDMALRYCRSQGAALPTLEEMEAAEAAGFYGGGIALREAGVYHLQEGLYDTAQTYAHEERARPNHISSVPNAYYYCIRRPAKARTAKR